MKMSERKWFNGPWVSSPTIPEHGWNGYEIEAKDSEGLTVNIADVYGPQGMKCEGNANLIAASTELYDSLMELAFAGSEKSYRVDMADASCHAGRDGGVDNCARCARELRALRALAKARGES